MKFQRRMEILNNKLIPTSLKMPKPLKRYTKEIIDLNFFRNRINEVINLIHGRKEIKLLLTFCLWLQIGRPESIRELKSRVQNVENSQYVYVLDLKKQLDLLNEKINYQYFPNIIELYDKEFNKTKNPQKAEYIQISKNIAKLAIEISIYLDSPIDDPWKFIEDIFTVPRPFTSVQEDVNKNLSLGKLEKFDSLTDGSLEIIKLFYSMFEYFSFKFAGIQEHFLRISATLFWCTRLEPVYSLEIYELLTEMFGEHKLESRSSQLYESSLGNDLIYCEKKGKNKNRAIIYFALQSGAEWIITSFFPGKYRLIIQQQAMTISFLRYSEDLLIRPWTINPMKFNYLMDIWFRSFLYSDNLDQLVFEKAREHRRSG